MSEQERLQRAIEATIAAGYQLDSEAFEFLSQNAGAADPVGVMNLAIEHLANLEEKPFFIEKALLEPLLQQMVAPAIEVEAEPPHIVIEEQPQTQIIETPSEAEGAFYPYAKDIESKITILEDVTGKLSSNGTLEEYLAYFQDRFKRLERLLRQRIDVRAATPILEALKSPPKTKLKIICMVTEKRDSKNHLVLSVEDLQGTATVLVSQNAPDDVRKKALTLMPDQVVCLAVAKTRTNLFLAEDIIFPEIGRKIQQKADEPVYAVLTSDLHIGSNKFEKEAFRRFILWLRGKYGNAEMKEIAGRVKYLLIAGDVVDGVGVYPGQAKELSIRDVHKQYDFAFKYLEKVPKYIEIIIGPGNHDAARKALPQPAIDPGYLRGMKTMTNVRSVGSPCFLSLHGVEVLMYHGTSLNDIIGVVPGMDNDHPEKGMRLFMQSRHLAPSYGQKTMLSPESRDYLVIDRVPDIFHAGHIHVLGYCNYRGVLVVNSGGWQKQTDYMEKLGLTPTPGKVPVVNLQTLETTILSFL